MKFAMKRFKRFWSQFKRSKRGITGLVTIILFTMLALFAPLIAPYDPIQPIKDKGKYPALGPLAGPKIAEKLCKPAWYKYLPNIQRGPIDIEEKFHTNITRMGGELYQLFGPLGKPAMDDKILLSYTPTSLPQLTVEFPNGTSGKLLYPQEWMWTPPNEIRIERIFPKETIIAVAYTYGVDVTENIEVIPDFQFSSDPLQDSSWTWSNKSQIEVRYNSTGGYNKDGCIQITVPEGAADTQVYIIKHFEFPYWEPPVSFWGHISARVVGSRTKLTVIFKNNKLNLSIPIITMDLEPSTQYQHKAFSSYAPEVWEISGSTKPEKRVFVGPANYSILVKLSLKGKQKTSIFIDNFNIIIYGNSFGLLGTDNAAGFAYPRDIFSTLIYGTRVSLIVGVLSAIFGTLIGLFLGLISGYVGGLVDELIMRIADLLLVLPTLPLFIILVAALKTVYGTVSMWNIILVLTLFGWMGFARSVRSMVLSLRERPFIEAAKAAGATKFYIIRRHLLPNVFALVYITLATSVPGAIITEASLSWLGLGDPMVPSWGKLLYDFQSSGIVVTRGLTEYWFWVFPASVAIALLATAFILIGYALDEILNPRLRMRR